MSVERPTGGHGPEQGNARKRLLLLAFAIVAFVALGYCALIWQELKFAP